jgi:N,N'-diacetylbacillosaminyl-diphospho-undecaprenol alpha-1,3-N-acetylgalactosaminyltransferase
LKMKNHVTCYSALPHSQAIRLLQLCDYFIMPSQREGFPRVILEAMLYKIPFVATDVGNVTEIVSKAQQAFLVPPKDPRQFANTLTTLINQNNATELMKQNYQTVTKHYTLPLAKQKLISLLHESI